LGGILVGGLFKVYLKLTYAQLLKQNYFCILMLT